MWTIKRWLKDAAKSALHRVFETGQRLGVDILPRHFYSEIPDLVALKTFQSWKQPFCMAGVEGVAIAAQIEFVRSQCGPLPIEQIRRRDIHSEACALNGEPGYGRIESEFLYAFVHSAQPRTIFQIGCGVSTAVCLLAAADAGYAPEIICVEPYPTAFLISLAQRGTIQLVQNKVENLPLGEVDALGNNLLFFVDSTHTLGPAGEVSRIILEILPLLKHRAYVHFHDITFPYDYQPQVLNSALTFPHESALLHAFLAYNKRFSLRVALSMLHHQAAGELKALFPGYQPAVHDHGVEMRPGHFPSSAYLEVVG